MVHTQPEGATPWVEDGEGVDGNHGFPPHLRCNLTETIRLTKSVRVLVSSD